MNQRKAETMNATEALDAQANTRGFEPLSDEDIETILTIARNGQSGRITEYEIRTLVAAYRALHKL